MNRAGAILWIFTCEHAGYAVPREYGTLGLSREDLRDHIGWDIGAAAVAREAASRLSAPLVASHYSRLLIDLNRAPDERSLIVERSDGRRVPGNEKIGAAERRRRIRLYHEPYHDRVDRAVSRLSRRSRGQEVRLLSMHSFTPSLDGRSRPFDVGVLFDEHPGPAHELGRALRRLGLRVRYNEPYSGLDGLIYAARRHGLAHDIVYLELEVNNALVRTRSGIAKMGRSVARALAQMDGARHDRT